MAFGDIDYGKASAVDVVRAALAPYGLGDLAQRMYEYGKNNDNDAGAAYLWLRDQPEYKQAFPGMALREQNKLAPMSEEQYIQWTSQMRSTMQQNGIPAGFYDSPDDFATMIGNDLSPQEVQDRVVKGVVAAQNAPQEVKDALFNYYGIDQGHLAAYWLDPNNKGKDLVQRQAAVYAGAAAKTAGFQDLTRQEAEQVASYGQSQDQLQQGFGTLVHARELLNALPGEQGSAMTREDQLRFVEGSPQAQEELARRANVRKAQFAGGGGFAESAKGVSGLQSP